MKAAKSVREASDIVLTQYERPADQSESVKKKRASYGQKYYDRYAKRQEVSHLWERQLQQALFQPQSTESM